MKRQTLAARATFIHEKQEALARAARDFTKEESNDNATNWAKEKARRDLNEAGIAYGLACKRYLGGRE